MGLLLIWRRIWRYRVVTLPVIALTLLGAFYIIAVKAPVYQVSSSYILINPPPPPTPDEIARNPALGRINSDNPYTRFSDQTAIVSLLSSSLSSDAARQELVKAGADPSYTVSPDLQLGYSSSVVEITGVGSTPQAAVHTAELVGAGLTRELDRVQVSQGVDPHYMIKAQPVVAPNSPKLQLSSTLRPLVGMLAICAILLLVVVSAAEALDTLRAERKRNSAHGTATSNGSVHNGEYLPEDETGDAIVGTATDNSTPQKPRRRRGKGASRRNAGNRRKAGTKA